MAVEVTQEEQDNQKKGAITSLTAHVTILLIAMLPWMTFPDPPPGPAGVLVSFGEPDQGMDRPERAAPSQPITEVEEVEEVEEPSKPVVEKPKRDKPKPKDPPKVNTDKNSKERAIAAAKKKEEDRLKKEKADKAAAEKAKADEARRAKEAAAKAKRDAEAAAKAKRDAEAQALRDAIGGAFDGGTGNGGNPGDQGQPDGDPDGKALEGVSTGSGEIGGGLGGRGVLSKPKILDNSQKTGDVVVKVCVNANGQVTSAKFTQKGSTTSNAGLVATAVKAAKKYKFSKGGVDNQCGTIKIKFRVR